MLDGLARDFRYAVRTLRRSPGFAATAILVLAIGIGSNTAIFSVVDAVLLRPLPYPEPDRLVRLMSSTRTGSVSLASVPKFTVWRDELPAFDAVAAYHVGGPGVTLGDGDGREQLKAVLVSADYFRLFGARAAAGRTFSTEEDRLEGRRVTVLSHRLWMRHFAGDERIIGRTIRLSGEGYQVIGVIGPSFVPEAETDIWLPLQADPQSTDQANYLRVAGRLKTAATVGVAARQLSASTASFRRRFPFALGPWEAFDAIPLQRSLVGDTRLSLLVLSCAVGFVLLIACANVANLLLARAAGRRQEVVTRAVLGAGRWRLLQQLFAETLVLAGVGGALGLAGGYLWVRVLLATGPDALARIGDMSAVATVNQRVLLFAVALSAFTGLLFGAIPALDAARVELGSILKASGGGSVGSSKGSRARSILVVAEIGLALLLLVGAGLLIRTFVAFRTVHRGFEARQVLTIEMALPGDRFDQTASVDALVRRAEQRVETVSGVRALATTCSLPLEPSFSLPFTIDRRMVFEARFHGSGHWRSVSPRYFEVFGITLLRGRVFDRHDGPDALPVVIINRAMARRFWQDNDPVGEIITIGRQAGADFVEPPRHIVGVVSDARDLGLNLHPEPMLYVPLAQVGDRLNARNNRLLPMTWVVRTTGDPVISSAQIQRELRAASGGLPLGRVRVMEEIVKATTARADFNMRLLSAFAAVALVLAAIGLYGVIAYSVQQRRQEFGIRTALGATPEDVRNMVVLQGMRLAMFGVLLGVASSLALSRVMSSLLFGVVTWDPMVLALVALLLGAVALLAAYLPARRATRVDPIVALRNG